MKTFLTFFLTVAGLPVFASTGPFFSLNNTNFVVTIGFLLFIALLVYLKVPGKLIGILDKRASDIQSELDEARFLREEAQSILADFERKQKEVQTQAHKIIENARLEASSAASQAKDDLKTSIARRIQAAEEKIISAQNAAVKEVRDTAVTVAIQAANQVIASGMSKGDANDLIDAAIKDVGDKIQYQA